MTTLPPHPDRPLVSLRTALILTVAVVCGVVAGGLVLISGAHPANAGISAVVGFAAAVGFLNKIIE